MARFNDTEQPFPHCGTAVQRLPLVVNKNPYLKDLTTTGPRLNL